MDIARELKIRRVTRIVFGICHLTESSKFLDFFFAYLGQSTQISSKNLMLPQNTYAILRFVLIG